MFENVVIFGGAGYIGGYTINYLVENNLAKKIYIFDLKKPRKEVWTQNSHNAEKIGAITHEIIDVRDEILNELDDIDVIFNYAAIHREPGHEDFEYYETNIKGAENVVEFSNRIGCKKIVFTSSIAPYGHSDKPRVESSQVVPYSPYGSSKLVAEKIHIGWQKQHEENRLITIRPGVIFGPHEDGNVPRMKNALKKGYFVYMGNENVRKSGGYVKELVNSIFWTIQYMDNNHIPYIIYNFSFRNPPTLSDYVTSINKVLGKRKKPLSLPFNFIYVMSFAISALSKLLSVNQPIHPVRVKKLKIDNMIIPEFLNTNGYEYIYSLDSCMEDWKRDCPNEW